MDEIKKMMMCMRLEKETADDRADQCEQKFIEQREVYERQDEEIRILQKRISLLTDDVDNVRQQLKFTVEKLDSIDKKRSESEIQVQGLTKILRAKETELEQAESKLSITCETLELATKTNDESDRMKKVLENRGTSEVERIVQLEKELQSTVEEGEESEDKYEDIAEQLAITEVELERGEAKLEAAETKVLELEDELRIIENIMKSLYISEQKAKAKQEDHEEQIKDLTDALYQAERRLSDAEKLKIKLQRDIDKLDEAVYEQKDKYSNVNDQLQHTFDELIGY